MYRGNVYNSLKKQTVIRNIDKYFYKVSDQRFVHFRGSIAWGLLYRFALWC